MANYKTKRSDIQTSEVVALYRQGVTIPGIATQFGCSSRTIQLRLEKAGEPRAPRGSTKPYPILGHAELARRWREDNKDRVRIIERARAQVRRALRTGRLIRPDVCESCGIPAKEPPQAAHENYFLPLLVRWLCRSCHVTWDHETPKTSRFRPALKESTP